MRRHAAALKMLEGGMLLALPRGEREGNAPFIAKRCPERTGDNDV